MNNKKKHLFFFLYDIKKILKNNERLNQKINLYGLSN